MSTVGFGSELQFAFKADSKIYIVITPDSTRKSREPDFGFKIVLKKYELDAFDEPPKVEAERPKTVAAEEIEGIFEGGKEKAK